MGSLRERIPYILAKSVEKHLSSGFPKNLSIFWGEIKGGFRNRKEVYMFDKMKQVYEFRKKAKEIQNKLRSQIIETESGAVKVTMNGEQKIQSVEIDQGRVDAGNLSSLEGDIKNAVEKAVERSQKIAAEMMKEITGGLGIPGL